MEGAAKSDRDKGDKDVDALAAFKLEFVLGIQLEAT